MTALNDLLDDLTPQQLTQLIYDHWVHTYTVTRGSIKAWRRAHSLDVTP